MLHVIHEKMNEFILQTFSNRWEYLPLKIPGKFQNKLASSTF